MAFDIKTGAAEAQLAFEAKGKPESFKEFGGCWFGSIKHHRAPEAGSGVELADAEISIMAWKIKSFAPPPQDGFRFVYVDELLKNEELNAKV